MKNGELLRAAAADRFDVLPTVDRGMEYEQNLAALPIAVLKLESASSKLVDLMPLVPAILIALGTLQPRTLVKVP